MDQKKNLSLSQIRVLIILGESDGPYSGCLTPADYQTRWSTIKALSRKGLVIAFNSGNQKFLLSPEAAAFYCALKAEFLSAMHISAVSAVAGTETKRPPSSQAEPNETPPLIDESNSTKSPQGSLNTTLTVPFNTWMAELSSLFEVRVIRRGFSQLDDLYRSGKTVHFARCILLQLEWAT